MEVLARTILIHSNAPVQPDIQVERQIDVVLNWMSAHQSLVFTKDNASMAVSHTHALAREAGRVSTAS